MLLQAASQMEDFVADVVSNYLVKPGGFLCGIAHTLAALATIMQRYAAILSVATVSVLLFIFYLPPTPTLFSPGNQKNQQHEADLSQARLQTTIKQLEENNSLLQRDLETSLQVQCELEEKMLVLAAPALTAIEADPDRGFHTRSVACTLTRTLRTICLPRCHAWLIFWARSAKPTRMHRLVFNDVSSATARHLFFCLTLTFLVGRSKARNFQSFSLHPS